MALTNAEKQAAHRAKQVQNLDSLTATVVDLVRKNDELHVQLAASIAKNHVLELKLAKLAAKGAK
jgi:hypothetical protein